eukprot:gene11757-biopygen1464
MGEWGTAGTLPREPERAVVPDGRGFCRGGCWSTGERATGERARCFPFAGLFAGERDAARECATVQFVIRAHKFNY